MWRDDGRWEILPNFGGWKADGQVTADVTDQRKEARKKQVHFVPWTPGKAQNIVSSEDWGRWLKPGESWDVFKTLNTI